MMDGAIQFISCSIDVGDLGAAPPVIEPGKPQPKSPYGVWGLLGSSNGNEAEQP